LTDKRGGSWTGSLPGRSERAFTNGDEREGRIRPVYAASEARADPKTGTKKRKVLGLSPGGPRPPPTATESIGEVHCGGVRAATATAGMPPAPWKRKSSQAVRRL
jgi:hypothetical protein